MEHDAFDNAERLEIVNKKQTELSSEQWTQSDLKILP